MKRGLIVSCQALKEEPLHSPFIMAKMALAAKIAGAIGIRANSIEDIKAIKKEVDLPIIGIIKKDYKNTKSYITPTQIELKKLIEVDIDIIALDATFDADLEMLSSLKTKYPNQQFMADISTVEEGLRAQELGFDYIGTTLVGYTDQSSDLNNFDVLKKLVELCKIPIVAEGNFDTPKKAKQALELGAYTVVVGSAITRPQLIAKKFIDELNTIK